MNAESNQSLNTPERERLRRVCHQALSFDHAAIGMAMLDLTGRWIDVNSKFCQMLGFERDELLLRSYESLTFEADLTLSRRRMEQLESGHIETCALEKRYLRSDGDVIWVQVHASRVPATPEREAFVITQARDITLERKTREALAESEAALSLALDGADLGMWHWRLREGEFAFNERAQQLLGYSEGEVGQSLEAVMALGHPDERAALQKAMSAHLKGHEPVFDRILRLRKRDGDYLWLLARGRVVQKGLDGRALKVSGTLMDVSKWKQLERRLVQLATTDELTGLSNRRSGVEALHQAFRSAERQGEPLSMLLLDVDHFKQINDQLGHDVGDQVLEALGAYLKASCRESDRAIRWGGEEFAVVLPETDQTGARAQAERLFEGLSPWVLDAVPALDRLTASLGLVTRRAKESPRTLMKRADALMYRAKQAGRNRIVSDSD